MSIPQCKGCRSRLRRKDVRCANCGRANLHRLAAIPAFRLASWAGLLGGGLLGAFVGHAWLGGASEWFALALAGLAGVLGLGALWEGEKSGCIPLLLSVVAVVAVILVPTGAFQGMAALLGAGVLGFTGWKGLRAAAKRLLAPPDGRQTFKESEALIRRRLRELRDRWRRLELLGEKAAAGTDDLLATSADILSQSGERLRAQADAYEAQLWRVAYARWRAELVALAEAVEDGRVDGRVVDDLAELAEAGVDMLRRAEGEPVLHRSEDGRDGIERLRETLDALKNLRKQALLRAAVAEASGVPAAESAADAAALEPRTFEALYQESSGEELLDGLEELERKQTLLDSELSRAESSRSKPRRRGRSRG